MFTRSSELRFARWSEIDFRNNIWIVSAGYYPVEKIKEISGHPELIFPGDRDPDRPMSENTIIRVLRLMGYDIKTEVCGHGFRTMACSALMESGMWSQDVVERQMSHQERNSVRAAYIHKAEHLDARKLMMQW